MADNVEADAGSGGVIFAGASLILSGDTALVPMNALGILTGTEGAWTYTLHVGGAGAVTGGVQRMTLASDDPAVALLTTISTTGIPITGTVTVGSHAVTNAGVFAVQVDGTALTRLTDIETNTDSGAVVGNGASATAQRVTLANDSTGIVSLTTGTASIGKLAANSGVDIGDVDVTSVIPGTGSTNLGKAIDTATGGTDTGVLALATRDDALSSLTPAEGDNVQLRTDGNGALWVIHSGTLTVGSHNVTNAGTFVVQENGAALTALQLLDNIVLAEDAAHQSGDPGVQMLAVRQDAATALGADGDYVPLLVDSSGRLHVTVGNTVTVNAHAVTNAGVFAVQVDGSALTALQLIDDAVYAEDVAAQAADKGFAILAVRRDADTTLVDTTNDYANLQVDANGYLKVEIFDGGGSHTVDNNGTFVTQIDGAALTALQLIDDPVVQDDAAFTSGTTKVMMVGLQADESGTDSVDEGDGGAARMTLDRKAIVTIQPHSAGGLSIFRSIDLDEGTLEVVKASPGCIYGMWVCNTSTGTRWVKFYDATSGTAGTGTPVITIGIPGNSSDDVAGLFASGNGIMFATGICVGATTGVADADTGAPGANDVIINLFYK